MITKKEIEKAAYESNLGYSTSHYDSFIEGVEWALKQVKNCSISDVVGRSEELVAFCRWYNQAIPSYETTEEEIVETYLRESN